MRFRNAVRSLALLPLAIGVAASMPSQAVTIRVDFAGQVTDVSGAAAGTFAVGDPVSGILIYDDSGTPDVQTADFAVYRPPPILRLDARVGTYQATGDPLAFNAEVWVYDDYTFPLQPDAPTDYFYFRTGVSGAPVGGLVPDSLQFGTGGRVGDDSLLDSTELLDLADWTHAEATLPWPRLNFLTFGAPGNDRVDWTITSYTATPEPGSGVLTLVGLATMAARRPHTRA